MVPSGASERVINAPAATSSLAPARAFHLLPLRSLVDLMLNGQLPQIGLLTPSLCAGLSSSYTVSIYSSIRLFLDLMNSITPLLYNRYWSTLENVGRVLKSSNGK